MHGYKSFMKGYWEQGFRLRVGGTLWIFLLLLCVVDTLRYHFSRNDYHHTLISNVPREERWKK
jgi:hypothetical protein